VAIVNHRSKREDFDLLIEAVRKLGEELTTKAAIPRGGFDESIIQKEKRVKGTNPAIQRAGSTRP
jgi:hypothetical protein